MDRTDAPKDRHLGDRLQRMAKFRWSLVGGILGALASLLGDFNLLVGAVGGSVLAYLGITLIVDVIGGAIGGSIYMPKGRSTPPDRGFSRAESLEVRERFEEALAAYERAISEDPADPEPYLRIARLLRDELRRPEEALVWFRKARDLDGAPPRTERFASREIVETLIHRIGDRRRALPELARLAHRHPEHEAGRRAREELRELKAELREEEEEDGRGA